MWRRGGHHSQIPHGRARDRDVLGAQLLHIHVSWARSPDPSSKPVRRVSIALPSTFLPPSHTRSNKSAITVHTPYFRLESNELIESCITAGRWLYTSTPLRPNAIRHGWPQRPFLHGQYHQSIPPHGGHATEDHVRSWSV